jgi:hypothetical protein
MKAYQATYILEQFVDSTNRWGAIFGDKAIEFPLSQKAANNLMDRIAGELSPENLHCDGEISGAQAASKARELNNIRAALEHYCLNNWLDTPECIY